jgi:hypothetical protein
VSVRKGPPPGRPRLAFVPVVFPRPPAGAPGVLGARRPGPASAFQLRPRLVRPVADTPPLAARLSQALAVARPPAPPPIPRPAAAGDDADSDLLELNADLLQDEPDAAASAASSLAAPGEGEPRAEDLPAGLTYHLHQQWAHVRPHWLQLREATRVASVRFGAAAWPRLLTARTWLARLWIRPTSWRRMAIMSAGAAALGAVFITPVALLLRPSVPPVAVARVPARALPAAPPAPSTSGPAPTQASVLDRPDPDAAALADPHIPHRALVPRQMAREAFEAGHAIDGVWYYRLGRRAHRHAPEDDRLTLLTINALADRSAADAAEHLLRDMGRHARPLLAETARSHPDPAVRQRARRIVANRK